MSVLTLAIESSCDETSAAVLRDGRTVVSNVISSQVPIHRKFGGVVPEVASRHHIEQILPVIDQALSDAQVTLGDIDHIAVTYGPGLVGALLVGVAAAKGLSFATGIPLVGVHHMEGHIFANFLAHPELEPPFMSLVVSGGHTMIVLVKDYESFEILGQTRDDAAGEAFDKIARVRGYPYPGGPHIDALAKEGNPDAIEFPRPLLEKGNFDFSFSGLKSAVLNYINGKQQKGESICHEDVAASFQKAITDVLVEKMKEAFGSEAKDILAAIGPAMGPDRFEVGDDVIQAFTNLFAKTEVLDLYKPTKEGKYLFNMWEANRRLLLRAGLQKDHIECADICTHTHTDLFFSYRKEKGKTGRHMAVMELH